jgi:ribosomal protein L24E
MKWLREWSLVIVATSGVWSVPAFAQDDGRRWMACSTKMGRELAYVTEPFVIEWDKENQGVRRKFEAIVRRERNGEKVGWTDCHYLGRASGPPDVPDYVSIGATVNVGSNAEPFMQRIVLFPNLPRDWYKDTSPEAIAAIGAPAPTPPKPSGPGVLVIEDNGIAARTKAWEDTVLQAQRQEAATRAKQVAETARSSAKHKVELARVFEEMCKRGNKQ